MRVSEAALALLLVASWAPACTAAAQSAWTRPAAPSESDIARARALYARGLTAVDEARWADALSAFEQAYALSGVAAALYNVATTLRALGRHVAAMDALTTLLEEHPEIESPLRQLATTMLDEERARVASLILSLPPAPAPRVLLDGRTVRVGATPDGDRHRLELAADPGPHHVLVRADGRQPFEWRGALEDGQRLHLDVLLPPAASGSRTAEVVAWIVAIGGAVLAAGAVVTGWAIWDADELDPMAPQVIEL